MTGTVSSSISDPVHSETGAPVVEILSHPDDSIDGKPEGKKDHKKQSDMTHAVSGSMAGIFSKSFLQPMDLIKTRMQVQERRVAYRSLGHAFQCLYKEGGVRAFYQGLTPNLLGSGVAWGMYFYTYNFSKSFYKKLSNGNENDPLPPYLHLASAGQAGIATSLVTNPIWVIKTRIQTQNQNASTSSRPYTGVINAFSRMIREEGFMSLYRGIGPALTLVSNGAIQFMTYEEMKKYLVKYTVKDEANLDSRHFLAMGAGAKAISSSMTYPIQVVRTRLYQPSSATPVEYTSATQVAKYVWSTQGARGFYRGLVPQLAKTVPHSALTFFAYENILRFLKKSGIDV